eukprot:8330942-Alexandrium_andersonii.AAC.1
MSSVPSSAPAAGTAAATASASSAPSSVPAAAAPVPTATWTGNWGGSYGRWEKHADGTWHLAGAAYSETTRGKYFDKSPPPEWDGKNPESTWRTYCREL